MSKEKENNYGADQIDLLEGLEPVRTRPGMYTDTTDPNHLLAEVIDNATDEILGGHASEIFVTLHADGSASVQDDGRGIPVDIHPKEKVPAVEVIFTKLHAGGKFKGGAYAFSGGLHGVGVTVTNALSSKLVTKIKRGGIEYRMEFNNGEAGKLEKIGKCAKNNTGTFVHFWPESQYFDTPKFNKEKLKTLCRAKAVLLAGSKITLLIEPKNEESEPETFEWQYAENLISYFEEVMSGKDYTDIYQDQFFFDGSSENIGEGNGEGLEWTIAFMRQGSAFKESYVNLIPTRSGGTHESGFIKGIFEALKSFVTANNMLPKGVEIKRDDVLPNISFLVSAKILNPRFHGQTKEKLTNKETLSMAQSCIKAKMENWLHTNGELGREIAEMVISTAQSRLKANKAVTVRKVGTATPPVPDKLSDCTGKKPEDLELFVVEGDSAGGSAKQGRDREFQAIFPLKGKPANLWDAELHQVLSAQEIHDLSLAIGVKPHDINDDPDEVLKGLRYHKIFALTDADVDGYHIETLLTALLVKHYPHLITRGHYGISVTPLYKVEAKGKVKGIGQDPKFYVLDDAERDDAVNKLLKHGVKEHNINVQRFKGLGEMNPPQLRETALDPDTRTVMIPVMTNEEIIQMRKNIHFLFSKSKSMTNSREEWISEYGDFGQFDV